MIKTALPDVTLVAVTSVAVRATIDALHASIRQVDFGQVLLLSDDRPPVDVGPAITWRRIERLATRADYSRFMLRNLAEHISTSHALCIQWDGFVLDGAAWDQRFLDYDYIGAIWPQFSDGHNVGNGGFSLRSRRLLEVCKKLPFDQSRAEDLIIGRLCRHHLEERGLRFAPESVARTFAYERIASAGREFGFHGAFNLVRLQPTHRAVELFRDLESNVLARSERVEILCWALLHGHVRLACQIAWRFLTPP